MHLSVSLPAMENRLQELNQKLNHMNQNREQIERNCGTLRDDMSQLSVKVDNMSLEVKDIQGSVKLQNKMVDNQTQLLVRKETLQRRNNSNQKKSLGRNSLTHNLDFSLSPHAQRQKQNSAGGAKLSEVQKAALESRKAKLCKVCKSRVECTEISLQDNPAPRRRDGRPVQAEPRD